MLSIYPQILLRNQEFKDKVRSQGISYVVIAEQEYSKAGLKRRVVTEKLIFVEG